MKIEFTFKHMTGSDALTTYTTERLERLEKFEMKPTLIQCEFWVQRHEAGCDLVLRSANGQMKASAKGLDIHSAIDSAVEKLGRQLEKRKSRVQDHKKPLLSNAGQLSLTKETLELDHSKALFPRGKRKAS